MTRKVLYLDDTFNFMSKNRASLKLTYEYDPRGKLVKETWVDLKKK